MNKKVIGIVAAVVVVAVLVIMAVIGTFTVDGPDTGSSIVDEKVETVKQPEEEKKSEEKTENNKTQNVEKKAQTENAAAEEKVFTPTFMYFVSEKDNGYQEAMASVEKLKKEYAGKVNFDIRDVDKNPENLENFPVEGMTPTLIMLNTQNDICAFSPMMTKYEDLKAAIDSAFAN